MPIYTRVMDRLLRESGSINDGTLAQIGTIDESVLAPDETTKLPARAWRRYTWRPHGPFAGELFPGFQMQHDYLVDCPIRAITTVCIERYSLLAYGAGRMVAEQVLGLEKDERDELGILHLLYGRSKKTHEYLTRTFSSKHDLNVKLKGEEAISILPLGLGSMPNDQAVTWSNAELIERGNLRAAEAGVGELGFTQRVAWGLLAAAERNPYSPVPENLSRMLLDCVLMREDTQPPSVDEEVVRMVLARSKREIRRHDGDNTEDFAKWFQGGNSNFVKRLMKARGERDLSREEIRWAMFLLAREAHLLVAQCHSLYTRTFAAALQEPLSPPERMHFEFIHAAQECFGGLSLPLLWARAPQFLPILQQIMWAPHDESLRRILWRIAQYYQLMILYRRGHDRQIQRIKAGQEYSLHPYEAIDPSWPDRDEED